MDILEEIKQILENHIGRGNEISAQVFENKFGNPIDKTHRKSRELIEKCADKYHIPIAGNDLGYYIISNEEELAEYKENLQSRINGIRQREAKMEKFFKERNKWNL